MIQKITRRQLLISTGVVISGGLVIALILEKQISGWLAGLSGTASESSPWYYIVVHPDNQIELIVHRSEMGQGARTVCAQLLAEELDADWSGIKVTQAQGHPKFGDQNTDGSTTVRYNWHHLRQAGAQIRQAILEAAAEKLKQPMTELATTASYVIHQPTNLKYPYSDFIELAEKKPLPTAKLKTADQFSLIGKDVTTVDFDLITQGKANYGIDIRQEDMLYACLARSPYKNAKHAKIQNEAAIKKMPGIVGLYHLDRQPEPINTKTSIAIVGTSFWLAWQARSKLKVQFSPLPESLASTAKAKAQMKAYFEQDKLTVIQQQGTQAIRGDDHLLVDRYSFGPYLAHCPMEPPNCTVHLHNNRCEIWAPTQHPQWARREVAKLLQIDEEQVTIQVTMLGGGFGRKSKPDFILEAVALAQQLKKPVQVIWTREDDIQHSFYRAINLQRIQFACKENGEALSWRHQTLFPTISTLFSSQAKSPAGFELAMGMTTNPYRYPHSSFEAASFPSDLHIGWLRSVCHTFHAHAINLVMNEMAAKLKTPAPEFHLRLLGEDQQVFANDKKKGPYYQTARLANCIDLIQKMPLWQQREQMGQTAGVGFAAHMSFFSYIAMTLKLVIDSTGYQITDVDCVLDCGTPINPQNIRAQIEGAVVFGLSYALYGEISLEQGQVQQSNFHDYPLLRHREMPKVNVHIVASKAPPTGIGEPGVPPVSAALATAIHHITGQWHYDQPLAGTITHYQNQHAQSSLLQPLKGA